MKIRKTRSDKKYPNGYLQYYHDNYNKNPEFTEARKSYARKYSSMYYRKNKELIHIRTANRIRSNPSLRIKERVKTRFKIMMRVYTITGKITSSKKYGIDYKAITEHLKPFPKDISKYHIDHIKPLCSFNFVNPDGTTNTEEIKKAFAPENLQWLTKEENWKKNGKWNGTN